MKKEKSAKVTTLSIITKALTGKKKGYTVPELVRSTGCNENTARRLMKNFVKLSPRRCRVSGKTVTAYSIAA